jgi:hypothetical protein
MADGIVASDDDDRTQRMLADPKSYFEQARKRARAQVKREIEDGLAPSRLRLHAG